MQNIKKNQIFLKKNLKQQKVLIKSFKTMLRNYKKKEEKQKILESLTQRKENLNAILGSKINFNKEGLGYLPKTKKKYDVNTINFVPQQKAEISPLIKMNYIILEKSNKNLIIKINKKEKGKKIRIK